MSGTIWSFTLNLIIKNFDDFILAQENSENTNDINDENEDVEIVIQIPEDQVEISSAHSNGQA